MGGLGCDNMTVVLVCLLQDETPEAFMAKCSRKAPEIADLVENETGDIYLTPEPSPVRIEPAQVYCISFHAYSFIVLHFYFVYSISGFYWSE